jgi:hypothetical protein
MKMECKSHIPPFRLRICNSTNRFVSMKNLPRSLDRVSRWRSQPFVPPNVNRITISISRENLLLPDQFFFFFFPFLYFWRRHFFLKKKKEKKKEKKNVPNALVISAIGRQNKSSKIIIIIKQKQKQKQLFNLVIKKRDGK